MGPRRELKGSPRQFPPTPGLQRGVVAVHHSRRLVSLARHQGAKAAAPGRGAPRGHKRRARRASSALKCACEHHRGDPTGIVGVEPSTRTGGSGARSSSVISRSTRPTARRVNIGDASLEASDRPGAPPARKRRYQRRLSDARSQKAERHVKSAAVVEGPPTVRRELQALGRGIAVRQREGPRAVSPPAPGDARRLQRDHAWGSEAGARVPARANPEALGQEEHGGGSGIDCAP